MKLISFKHFVIGVCMFASAGLAMALKPTAKIADTEPAINLEQLIPQQFGEWKEDKSIVPIKVSPEVQAKLDKIYGQTLTRTYINTAGRRVMLSIAYGANQGSDDFQVHRPEYCYSAQGFQVSEGGKDFLKLRSGELPIKRLEAIQGPRNEPITYWITIGDKATLPGIGRKLTQLSYGLTGKIPDGMLIRVSSISPNADEEYRLQDQFVNAMLDAVEPTQRVRLTGSL
ncbi:MAG TPA: EpsI family protein [Thiobacillus sp.]|nr:EpsI family protein [Thiobacillus sp.]